MRRLRSTTPPAARRTRRLLFRLFVIALVGLCTASRAQAGDDRVPSRGAIMLDPAQLDKVTAGALLAQIDASATAHGTTTAFTDAYANLQAMQGNALMVQVDPAGALTPRGSQAVDVTYGVGGATAVGDQSADCSVTATILATDVVAAMIAATKQTTLTTSICQCSLWAVSLVK